MWFHGPSKVPQLIVLLSCVPFLWSCEPKYTVEVTGSERDRLDTLVTGGLQRTYSVHLPYDYEATESPVVIMLHEAGASGESVKFRTSFDLDADAYKMMAVYPNATSDWAYGCGCTEAEADSVDDVQFLLDMIDELDADYGIDRDSVFLVGYSEGGLMAQKAVCDASDSFAALATVAATMSEPVAAACEPATNIRFLMIQGTEDDDFPWEGLDQGAESLLAADTVLGFWAEKNGCGERLESVYLGADSYFQFEVFREGFDACPDNGEAIMLRMEDAGHGWPGVDFSASNEIGQFLIGSCCGMDAAPSDN